MVYVDPEFRSTGVGLALLREAERLAQEADTGLVSLNVRSDNPRAIDLYKRFSYTETKRVDVDVPTILTGPVLHMTKQI